MAWTLFWQIVLLLLLLWMILTGLISSVQAGRSLNHRLQKETDTIYSKSSDEE